MAGYIGNKTVLDDNVVRASVEAATDSNTFTDADHSKLNAIETAATADQTGAQIKALYEAETNAFTDALKTKLDAIEASATADQTGAEIKALYEAETSAFTDAQFTKLAGIETSATADQTKSDIEGLGIELPAANLTGTIAAARLDTATTQAETDDSTKIATTEYVTDKITTLIGGAPSTLNDLNELAAAINDDANYNTTLTTALGTKLPKAGGQMTGNITMAGTETVDGRDLSVDGAKLDLIEASATADQTDAEIRAAVEAASDSNVFTDADHTKLNGVATSANNYTHPNHSGEVTSTADGATVIANNAVTTAKIENNAVTQAKIAGEAINEARLQVSNSPTNGYFLSAQSGNTGGLTWAEAGAPLYNANESSPSAQPSATGANAIAIGESSTASGTNSFAFGTTSVASGSSAFAAGYDAVSSGDQSFSFGDNVNATGSFSFCTGGGNATASGSSSIAMGYAARATNDNSIAFGRNTDATSNNAAALGYNAQASGVESVALGPAYAGGASSFAAGIATNGNSYGATSGGAIALGQNAKASYFRATAIGEYAIASGNRATAIGRSATSAGTYGFAGGGQSRADGDYSVALGQSFANGENSFAAGIGVTDASRGAMNINSVAIGQNANAGWNNSLAIGISATTGAANQIALGGTSNQVKISGTYTLPTADGSANQVLTTNGSGAVSFADAGGGADLYAANESSPSAQPSATGANAIAIGDSSVATASKSVAIGHSRADGISSFAASVSHNSTSYGAIGNQSVALGQYVKAGSNGIAIGSAFATTEGSQSVAIGRNVTAVGSGSLAMGHNSKANIIGMSAYTYGQFAAQGDSQSGHYVLKSDTTDATAEAMTTNNSTAGSTNQIVAASDTCITFSGTIVAMQNGAQDQGGWEIKGLLKNDGGTTTLVNSNVQTFADGNGWAVALSADNTNNALKVQVTGEASHNIRWVANIQTSEVTYA